MASPDARPQAALVPPFRKGGSGGISLRKGGPGGILLAAVLLTALPAAAQPAAPAPPSLASDPGFVDFARNRVLGDEDLDIHVSVKDPMIKLTAEFARASDPVLADVLEKLRAVDLYVYNVAEDKRAAVRDEISRQARQLEQDGWSEAISIRLKGARGHVFMRLVEGKPVGLAAMYLEDDAEAVFLNIVGPIDPAQVGRLANKFNLDLLSQAVKGTPLGPEDSD